MKITLDNYEAFLLDRMEGTLSDELSNELEVFLLAHPEVVDTGELPTVEGLDTPSFDLKESLKHDLPPQKIDLNHSDDLLIAYLEGDLSEENRLRVESLITTDASLAKDWRLIQLTKLSRGEEVFANKRSLKKGGVLIPLFKPMAIAASIAVLFGLFWFLSPNDANIPAPLANTTGPTPELNEPNKENNISEQFQEKENRKAIPVVREIGTQPTQRLARVSKTSNTASAPSPNIVSEEPTIRPIEGSPRSLLVIQRPIQVELASAVPLGPRPVASTPSLAKNETDTEDNEAFTVSELVADVFRSQLLAQENRPKEELHTTDVLAMIERGVDNVSNGNAGFIAENDRIRRRWGIRLGGINLEADLSK